MIRIALSLVLALLGAAPARAGVSSGEPVVYSVPAAISAQNGQTLSLYVDYANSPDVGPSSGTHTMCVDEDGDETCGFDVWIELQSDGAVFQSFTPASGQIVGHIDPATQTTLKVNGIDTNGMPIPAPIGTLVVDAAGANQAQILVTGRHRVGAGGQLDAIQRQVIATLPEPRQGLQLASGVLVLAWLVRRRGRSGQSG